MRTGIKALIDENQKLRELLGSVAGFIVRYALWSPYVGH